MQMSPAKRSLGSRSSQEDYDVIRLTRRKAAVWTVDAVARLIKISKIELITRENLEVNGVAFLFASKFAFFCNVMLKKKSSLY